MRKSTIFLIAVGIFIGVSILTTLGIYGYYHQKDKKATREAAKKAAEADPTKDWATYLSDKLYFTFKYPTSWNYEQSGYTNEYWNKQRFFSLDFKPVDLYFEINPWTTSASPIAHSYDYMEKTSTSTVKLDTQEAVKTVYKSTAKGKEIEGGNFEAIVLKFNHGTDAFAIHFKYNIDTQAKELADYDNLIKTFKFTQAGPKDTTYEGWKTYTNNEIGYQLKYPPTWSVEYKEDNDLVAEGQLVAKYIIITTGNGNKLYFGLKKSGEESFSINNRTGIGAGEDIAVAGKSFNFLGDTLIPKAHVWQGKTKEYFFPFATAGSNSSCNCEAMFWFDPATADGWDSNNTGETDLDNIGLIFKSVTWIK